MAYWKKPFTFLYSVFSRKSVDNLEKHRPPISSSDKHASPLNPQWKDDVEAFVLDLWKKLHTCEEIGHTDNSERLLTPQDCIPEEKNAVRVAQEVLKEEVVITLQNIRDFREAQNRSVQKLIDEQKKTIETLTKQLRVLSRQAGDAQEALQLVIREKHDLQYTHGMYQIQNGVLKNLVGEKTVEKENLEAKVRALTMSTGRWELKAEGMQEAKMRAQVRALRAEQNAELAELRAKHTASQKKMLDERLKEAESSSNTIAAHVKELRGRQTEILRILSINSRASGRRFVGNKIDSLVRKSSQALRRLWTSFPHGKRFADHELAEERGGAETANIDAEVPRTFRNGKPFRKVHDSFQDIGSHDVKVEDKAKPRPQRRTLGNACDPHVVEEISKHQANESQPTADGDPNTHGNTHAREQGTNGNGDGLECGHETDQILRALRSRSVFSTSYFSAQSSSSSSDLIRTQNLVSKTLEALEDNLAVLQEVIEVKQREIDRLHGELGAAAKQSHAFEVRLGEEKQKRQLEHGRASMFPNA